MGRLDVLFVSLAAVGCASSGKADLVGTGEGEEGGIELVVVNRSPNALTVFAVWQGGRRIRLGELRGGATRRFTTPHDGPALGLSLDRLSRRRIGGDEPDTFVPVQPGDRLEWVVDDA